MKSSFTLASDLKKPIGVSVNPSTVKTQLNAMGLKGCVAVKKPLRKGNKQKKISTRLVHWNWIPEMWSKVLWTAESKFSRFSWFLQVREGSMYAHEALKDNLNHVYEHQSSVVEDQYKFCVVHLEQAIWFWLKALWMLIITNKYHAIPSGQCFIGNKFILQDNDPTHTAENIKLLVLSEQWTGHPSLDLNITEYNWHDFDRENQEMQPTSKTEFQMCLLEAWKNIPAGFFKASLSKTKSKGGHTEYWKIWYCE